MSKSPDINIVYSKWGFQTTVLKKDFGKEKIIMENKNDEILEPNAVAGEVVRLGVSGGLTLNIGNYQSCRIDVWVEMPTTEDKLEETYHKAKLFVERKVLEQQDEIKSSISK